MSFINIMGINLTRKMWKAFRGFDDATIDRLAEKPYSTESYIAIMQDKADDVLFVTPKNAETFMIHGVRCTFREVQAWLFLSDPITDWSYSNARNRFNYDRAEFLDTFAIFNKHSVYSRRISIFRRYYQFLVGISPTYKKHAVKLVVFDELEKLINKTAMFASFQNEIHNLHEELAARPEKNSTSAYAKLLDERKFLVNKISGLENTVARYEKTISEQRAEITKIPEELELARSEASQYTENSMVNRYRPFLTFFNLFWANHANELKQLQIEQPDVTDIAKLLEYIERLKSAKLLDYIERTKP